MHLWAFSDLHITARTNRAALEDVRARPRDWLILAGDVCETDDDLAYCFERLAPRFGQLVWVPGNHELWTLPSRGSALRGVARYERLVEIARSFGVLTPEDPYPLWPGDGPRTRIAPLFLLYDYSFGPEGLTPDEVKRWSLEANIQCTDEYLLHPDPHPTRQAWCHDRLARTEPRLAAASADAQLVLVHHWPLRRDVIYIPRVPRFLPWCGTRHTEDWHLRFHARVVVSGHLHTRRTDERDGVRFEEVSVGYPRDWDQERGLDGYLRRIL
jgi:3',5'-cyclic AMP phosphodiesterase CpdA